MKDSVTRSFGFALESRSGEEGDGRTLEGYAAVFNKPTRIHDRRGEYDEVILPGAFRRSLSRRKPVLQFDHGKDSRIGGTPIGVFEELAEDARGLYVRARLFDHPDVERVRQAIEAGAISGMSFRFSVPDGGDRWEARTGEVDLRSVADTDVHELGPVVFPAYDSTSVSVRGGGESASVGTPIEAYLVCWDTVKAGNDPLRRTLTTTTNRAAYDGFLANRGGVPVPILLNHGWDLATGEQDEPLLAEPAGYWTDFRVDDIGLRASGHLFDTPLGVAVREEIRAGRMTACSSRTAIYRTRPLGNGVDEILEGRLVEGGPTPAPADDGAVIISLGGRPITAYGSDAELQARALRILAGPPTRVVLDLDRAERIAIDLARKRRAAESAYGFSRSVLAQPWSFSQWLDREREADEVDELLRSAVGDDNRIYRELAAKYRVPAKVDLVERVMASALAR